MNDQVPAKEPTVTVSLPRSYRLVIECGAPGENIDGAVRQATAWLCDSIDESGEHDLTVTVTDETGELVAQHQYQAH